MRVRDPGWRARERRQGRAPTRSRGAAVPDRGLRLLG